MVSVAKVWSAVRMLLGHRWRRAPAAVAALLLSWGALTTTVAISGSNLGARDHIRYINGGKVFLEHGAMWYHTPGLGSFELAPQNIGGQGNLRNNDVALLERGFSRLDAMDVDLSLDPGAIALLALDHHVETSFTALRVSAMDRADTPFSVALVRFEGGRAVETTPVPGAPTTLAPGRHRVSLGARDGRMVVAIDDHEATLGVDLAAIPAAPAIGSGELDVTLHRWAVSGTDSAGRPLSFEEDWSLWRWLRGRLGLVLAAGLAGWVVLVGLPTLKASLETLRPADQVLVRGALRPTPRLVYGLLCLIPATPLVLQWLLVANYLLLVWLGLIEIVASRGRVWAIPDGRGPARTAPLAAAGASALLLGLVLHTAAGRQRVAPLGQPSSSAQARLLRVDDEVGPLRLGAPRLLPLGDADRRPLVVRTELTLAEGEAARIDLLREPPTDHDLFQVDRVGLYADEDVNQDAQGPSGHDVHGVSVLLSAAEGLPSEILRTSGFDAERSPRPWELGPGTHEVEITADFPIVQVAVDGVVREVRTDLARAMVGDRAGWRPKGEVGAVQALAWSKEVQHLGELRVLHVTSPDGASPASRARRAHTRSRMLALAGTLSGMLGLGLLLLAPRIGPGSVTQGLAAGALRVLRGNAVLFVLVAMVATRWPALPPWLLVGAAALSGLNQFLLLRTHGTRLGGAVLAAVLTATVAAEAGTATLDGWRRATVSWWNRDLSPDHWWAYDPMLRRLNPWYIDMRFKRRPWRPSPPPGRTRVLVFGGSQTYGWGIPSKDRDTFSDRLQVELRERGHDVEVINASFPGVKTTTGLRWYAGNMRRYEPDIVVVNYVVNEFMDVDTYGVWEGARAPDRPVAPLVLPALLRRLGPDVRNNHLVQIVLAHQYKVLEMEDSLRTWVDLARTEDVQIVFSIEPTNLYVESAGAEIMRNDEDAGAAMRLYRRLGDELGVPVYDPLPHFLEGPTDLLFYDTMHMSRLGHAVFARGLADRLESSVLPPPPTPDEEAP